MTPEELKEMFRKLVPESNYEECKGCHTGSEKCPPVHSLYKICPCKACIVKTSCTDYCNEYIYRLRMSAARHSPGIMRIIDYSHKGYTATLSYKGHKIQLKSTLWRYMDPIEKAAILAGSVGIT